MTGPDIPLARRFARNEEGSQSVVFLLMLPLLLGAFAALYDATDAFRVRAIARDATAVVSDVLSRQTAPIDQTDLDGLRAVARQLTGLEEEVGLRITQLRCSGTCEDPGARTLEVVFSRGAGIAPLGTEDFSAAGMQDAVPMMLEGDRVVLVQTRFDYPLLFGTPLGTETIETAHVTRMRFTPRLCWESCNP